MKNSKFRIIASSLLSASLLLGVSASAFAQDAPAAPAGEQAVETLTVDPVHSNAMFRVKHNDAAYVFGDFLGESGEFTYDPNNPENSTFNVEILVDSISTGNEQRDAHLKSADFFDAKQFPKLTFKSTEVKKRGVNTLAVTGDLTIHGVTKPITTIVQMTGTSTNDEGQQFRGFYTTFNINRTDFGMDYGVGTMISDNVKIILSFETGVAAK